MKKENWKYRSEAGISGLIPVMILLAVFGGVFVWTYMTNNGAYIFAFVLTLIAIALLVYSIYAMVFIKLYVNDEGFYIRTGFSKGRYYKYSEIREAWESSGKVNNGVSVTYLNIRTSDGDVIKFRPPGTDTDAVDHLLYMINGEVKEDDDEY